MGVFAPLVLLLDVFGKAVDNLQGSDVFVHKNGGAGIAGAVGRVPDFLVVWKINFCLALFGFGLLEAENVWGILVDKALEGAFFDNGAEAVDVPGIEFHMESIARILYNGGQRDSRVRNEHSSIFGYV